VNVNHIYHSKTITTLLILTWRERGFEETCVC
jgi:hypothetical protein